VARYAQVDVAFANEGRYIGRWKEDAVFFLSILYCIGDGKDGKPLARGLVDEGEWREGGRERMLGFGDLQCHVVVLH